MIALYQSSSTSKSGSYLRVEGLSFSYPNRRVLTDVSFVVSAGERVGVIGENGAGKSTLLRLLASQLEPDAGKITFHSIAPPAPAELMPISVTSRFVSSSPLAAGFLHQELPFPPSATVAAVLEHAVAPLRQIVVAVSEWAAALASTPNDAAVAENYAHALELATMLDAWEVDARIGGMRSGFGLSHIETHREIATLSGGQRARLALAHLLLSSPEVLLLDEPTNHLDQNATDFLVSVLSSWRGPVLIASHDRAFLDQAVTTLIDLDPAPKPLAVTAAEATDGTLSGFGVTRFTGTFSEYRAAQAAARSRWEQQYRDEQAEISRLRAAVKQEQKVGHSDWKPRSEIRIAQKYYADRNARVVARRVNDARARLAELERSQIRKPPRELQFGGLVVGSTAPTAASVTPVLSAVNVSVAERLAQTSITVSRGEKWLITGANGVGKSTLLHVLAGHIHPTTGQVVRPTSDRIGVLGQDLHLPDPHHRGADRTVIEAYTDLVGSESGGPARAEAVPLSTFGLINGRDFNHPVRELSLGQQRRLELAVLLANPPEILLLDEPTNHFSLSLVTELETALADYPGTVVVASHDRWLLQDWTGPRLHLTGAPA